MPNNYYPSFDFYNMKSNEHLHLIEKFKTIQQTTPYTCGISCVMMVLGYYGISMPDEMDFAKLCHSKKYTGTRLIDLISALKMLTGLKIVSTYDLKRENGVCFKNYHDFKKFAIESIDKKIPLIVENCEDGGYYRVLIGIDEVNKDDPEQDVLIFADPSDIYDGNQDGYNFSPASRFFCMWFDDHCLEQSIRQQSFIQIFPKND